MEQREKTILEETAIWRKLVRRALNNADRPTRLDREWTRGKTGVVYEPQPASKCPKHWIKDEKGNCYHVNDPFCKICFPEPAEKAGEDV